MELFRVDTIAETVEKLKESCGEGLLRTEAVSLEAACGRVLSEDIRAEENIPPYRRSTMDGYAVRSSDLGAAGDSIPTMLRVSGEVMMGRDISGLAVEPGCAVYVPTGGELPEDADAVVMAEYCEAFAGGMLAVSKAAAPGENVVQAGEDITEGSVILARGRRLRPQDTGVLAAAGVTSVPVYVPWELTVISTGDELVDPHDTPGSGQIRDINSYTLAARSEEEGFTVVRTVLIGDDREALESAVEAAKKDSDAVILSGGSSQGKKDMTAELIDRAADSGVLTHGIAAKPGKPTITGYDSGSGTVFIGLPGHPAAALIVFGQVFIRLWRDLTGQPAERTLRARVTANTASAAGRRTFQPVRLRDGDIPDAEPVIAKSGMMLPVSMSDGYFEMSENQEGVRAGDIVDVHLWE